MDFIEEELVKMGVRAISVELIRDKDGVTVARVRPAAGVGFSAAGRRGKQRPRIRKKGDFGF